ncbi:hypothetical protein BaRGS_00017331 [Batillaria attramentaria]|uniref:BTB domain-containing protein n=1 Tax=Batillaria attramentaria TaxID=370345 RepID=A0ABD0KXK7_9CAEN
MKRNLDPDEESAETNSKRLKLIHGSLDDGVADVSGETSPAGFWENLTGSAVDLHLQNIQPQAELASVSDSHQALPADAVRETVPKLSKRSTGSLGDDKETSENEIFVFKVAVALCHLLHPLALLQLLLVAPQWFDVLDVADESLHTEAASSQQHGDVLLNNMYQLWRDGRLLDLQLDINGITVWVHKLVVLGLSPYAGLIMAGLQNEKVNCLKIQVPQPVHRSSVAALIIYLYTGRLVLNYCTVLALKCIGEALRMTYLQKLCSTYLSNCKHLAESCIRTSNTVTLPETLMYKQPEEDKRGDVLPVTGSAKRKCRKPLMMSQGVTSDPPQKYASLASGQCDEGIRPKDAVTQKHVAKTMQSCKTEKTEDMSDCHAVNPPESEILDLSKSGEHRDMCTADERTYEYRHAHAQEPECVADSAPVGDNVHAADPPARGDAKVPDTISGNRR